jgi:hypothetical protein
MASTALFAGFSMQESEEAAEALQNAFGHEAAFQDFMLRTFGAAKLQNKALPAAVSVLPALTRGPVITTNFDPVVETVFSNAGHGFERVVRGAEIDTFGRVLDQWLPFLLKLHGDADDRTHRILTAKEYRRHYGNAVGGDPATVAAQLERILIRGQLLFLGCSLNADRLLTLLAAVHQRYGNVVHYAIVERPERADVFQSREAFLAQRGIRPIWYPTGRHAVVAGLLEFLVQAAADEPSPGKRNVGRDCRSVGSLDWRVRPNVRGSGSGVDGAR